MASKTILITGASSGFGKLAVELLLDRGHRVVAALRGGEARAKQVFGESLSRHADALKVVDMHLERPETYELLPMLLRQEYDGKLDALVNNAGYGLMGALDDQTPEQLRHQFEVCYFAPMLLTRAVLPALRAAQGRILNISSICGLVSFPFYGAYVGVKHALEAHTEALYFDLKHQGVQVGLIEPGAFRTDFVAKGLLFGEGAKLPQSLYYQDTRNFAAWVKDKQGYSGNPTQVARLIVKRIEQNRIPLRSVVGKDAKAIYWLKRLLPERLRLWILSSVFSRFAFRR